MRAWLTLAAIALGFAAPVAAQQDSAAPRAAGQPRDSANVLVLEHDLTGPGEFARVILQKGQVYRAELNTATRAGDLPAEKAARR
jgi:hypothetical protein